MKNDNPIIVLGAGSWGTALALSLANNKNAVRLWGHLPEAMQKLEQDRENKEFLPGFPFPNNLSICQDLKTAFAGFSDDCFQDIVVATPSSVFVDVIKSLLPYMGPNTRILCASKGLTEEGNLLHDEFVDLVGKRYPFGLISGPSFAKEVAQGLPTAVALATTDANFTKAMQARFHSQHFRVYVSDDLIGLEIGAVIKNVMAIAVGLSDGLGYGANARSALITRGLSEMKGLCIALGGKSETLMGLAGVGDLILTCTDDQSRNRRFGLALGRGLSPTAAEQSVGQVVEGKRNAAIVLGLFKKHQVESPICEQVVKVIEQKITPQEAVDALLSRPPRQEI